MTDQSSVERRAYRRGTAADARATVHSGSRRIAARIINISAGGLALETSADIDLEPFVRIGVRLLPDADRIDFDGIVRRSESGPGVNRWAMEFVEPRASSLAIIERFVAEQAEIGKEKAEAEQAAKPVPRAIRAGTEATPSSASDQEAKPDKEGDLKNLFDDALDALGTSIGKKAKKGAAKDEKKLRGLPFERFWRR